MTKPAILGGTPVRTAPWPKWPVWGDEERKGVLDVLESGQWGGYSDRVAAFEEAFGRLAGARRCSAMANGTVTLISSLVALGVRPGDEVIVPSYTFAATANAVALAGATPVFADVEYATWNMDVAHAASLITDRTRAIVPVHFAGHPVDMDPLMAVAVRHGIGVLEDAAHAPGSSWQGTAVGSLGHIASFSFQGFKNLTSGEGGAITTNDDALAEAAWTHGNHGRDRDGSWYTHRKVGSNHRLTGFQAAILLAALGRYEEQLARRMAAGRYLRAALAGSGLTPAAWDERAERHAHHLLPLHYDRLAFGGLDRADFALALIAEGIPCPTGYPVPLNRQPAFGGRPGECPVADAACEDTVWISQHLLLAEEGDLADIVEAVGRVRTHAAIIAARS